MTRRRIAALVCGVLLATAGGPARADRPAKEDRAGVVLDRAALAAGRVEVEFHLDNAITDETLELIHSGIPLNYRHRIELRGQRRFWLSPRKVLSRVILETSVEYDALTGRYSLTRLTTLREPHGKEAPPPRAESTVTSDVDEMMRWMVGRQRVRLFDPIGDLPEEPMRVAVESSIGRHFVMLVFPARYTVDTVGPVAD